MVGGLVYYVVVVAMWRTICGLTTDIAIATSSSMNEALSVFGKDGATAEQVSDGFSMRPIANDSL